MKDCYNLGKVYFGGKQPKMSEFKELIKNFENIRNYMRDFYIYGFKMRNEYQYKSLRSYDNEKRRIEIWLGEYIKWDYSSRGKSVFISIDSACIDSNPLYQAWKAKSFTSNDIMLHFFLLSILEKQEQTATSLTDKINEQFQVLFEPQTVRNKLKEYEQLGILTSKKRRKAIIYQLSKDTFSRVCHYEKLLDSIQFFSEIAPLGVIGSTLLDKAEQKNELFHFKHHFIVFTLEDEILLKALEAMSEQKEIQVESFNKRSNKKIQTEGIPFKIIVSTQNGRRYLSIYKEKTKQCSNLRLDNIIKIKQLNKVEHYEQLKETGEKLLKGNWGVSFGSGNIKDFVHILFLIDEQREDYVIQRLEREKRGGKLQRVKKDIYSYEIELYNAHEMLPWIKTFIGRILKLESSNKAMEKRFYDDMEKIRALYLYEEE